MNNENLLEFYQHRLYKKLIGMQQMERAAYMIDLFGKRWMEVYDHMANLYPQLLDTPNVELSGPTAALSPEGPAQTQG